MLQACTLAAPLERLPDEILLQILSHLTPENICRLQLVSRKLRKICLDNEIWKQHSFIRSTWFQALSNRRFVCSTSVITPESLQSIESPVISTTNELGGPHSSTKKAETARARKIAKDMANWDPSFPQERVSWYDEYIHRQGSTSINWLQTPKARDRVGVDVHGVALYNPYGGNDGTGTMLAVAPLEDGSVCLWDVNGTRGKQGGILIKSKSDILFFDGPGEQNRKRSKMIDSSIADRISVDNYNHKAFFAVQSHLIEVDLNRLDVVSRQSFEWSITTLSRVDAGLPLTVGTTLGIHLHDFRANMQIPHDGTDKVDGCGLDMYTYNPFKAIFDPRPLSVYASLSQPTPNSILHLPQHGSDNLISNDIFVAGRFKSILYYDRRQFPKIAGTIYSGATLTSMTALPYPFSTNDYERRKQAVLGFDEMSQTKNRQGRTLIVGGNYKQKGSLEMYGLGEDSKPFPEHDIPEGRTLKNRHTAASSSILSLALHGTRLVSSDGSGFIKWFERDGTTECRRLKIGHSETEESSNTLFGSAPSPDDVARKILSTKTMHNNEQPNNDNILFWTGEKLGMVHFTSRPLHKELNFEVEDKDARAEENAMQEYVDRMRRALEEAADEVRYMGKLSLQN